MGNFFFAVKALIERDGKILIIKRSDKARGQHYEWELPGGRMEFGETVAEALHREVREETGLSITIRQLFRLWQFHKNQDAVVIGATFWCSPQDDTPLRLSEEHTEARWVEPEEITTFKTYPGVREELLAFPGWNGKTLW